MFSKKQKKFIIRKEKPKSVIPFKYNCSDIKSKKLVVYDPKIKELIKFTTGIGKKGSKNYIPGAMEKIDYFYKHKMRPHTIYKDPKNRFEIYVLPIDLIARNTHSAYKLDINCNSKIHSFYIKEYFGIESYMKAPQEMILQKYLEKHSINIIKPKFAISLEYEKSGYTNNIIAYDFTNLKNVMNTRLDTRNKELSNKMYAKIEVVLQEIESYFKNSFANKNIKDIVTKNCYYKKVGNKYNLYLSDLFVSYLNKKELVEFAKKEGLIE